MSPDRRPGRDGASTKANGGVCHLGCEKNRVDTEHMLGLLSEAGYGVSSDESDASVVVVNTCSFIQDEGKNPCGRWSGWLSRERS